MAQFSIQIRSGSLAAQCLANTWLAQADMLRSPQYRPGEFNLTTDPRAIEQATLDNGFQLNYRPAVVARILSQAESDKAASLKLTSINDRRKRGEFHFRSLPRKLYIAEFSYGGENFRLLPNARPVREFMYVIASMGRQKQLLRESDLQLMRELTGYGLIPMFNSIGAGASVPFSFHFQATSGDFALETANANVVMIGRKAVCWSYTSHPMRNVVFDGRSAYADAFSLIKKLHEHGFPYNVVGFRDRVVVFPKRDLHRGLPGAVECLGSVNARSSEELKRFINNEKALKRTVFRHSIREEELAGVLSD